MAKPQHPVDNRPDQSEGPGDRGAEAEVLVADMETGGVTQGDKAAGPPPKENRTSGRIAKRPRRVDQRRRWRRMRRMMRKGTRTERPQGGNC